MSLEYISKEPTCMTGRVSGKIFRCTGGYNESTLATTFWPQIDHPVRRLDDIYIMFYDDYRMTSFDEAIKSI